MLPTTSCRSETFISDTDIADRPIRIFGGSLDDYNPIPLCKAHAERLKAAGHNVQITEYATAPHAFASSSILISATTLPAAEAAKKSIKAFLKAVLKL